MEIIPLIQTFGHFEWLLKLPGYESYRDNPSSPMIITPCIEETYVLLEGTVHSLIKLRQNSHDLLYLFRSAEANIGLTSWQYYYSHRLRWSSTEECSSEMSFDCFQRLWAIHSVRPPRAKCSIEISIHVFAGMFDVLWTSCWKFDPAFEYSFGMILSAMQRLSTMKNW